MGLPSNRSRAHARRIEREVIEAKRLALVETFSKGDPAQRERLAAMSYPEIVAAKNAGHLTTPELPLEGGSDA